MDEGVTTCGRGCYTTVPATAMSVRISVPLSIHRFMHLPICMSSRLPTEGTCRSTQTCLSTQARVHREVTKQLEEVARATLQRIVEEDRYQTVLFLGYTFLFRDTRAPALGYARSYFGIRTFLFWDPYILLSDMHIPSVVAPRMHYRRHHTPAWVRPINFV